MLSHPFSRGSVHITSPDGQVKPKIDFVYYNDPLDLEIHARHLQTLNKLAATFPLPQERRSMLATVSGEAYLGTCERRP